MWGEGDVGWDVVPMVRREAVRCGRFLGRN